MKTAVFIYGEYRDFNIASKSWSFLKDLDCDVYVSTWDYSLQTHPLLDYHVEKNITPNMILDYIPNATFQIVNESEIYGDKIKNVTNHNKMIFHSKNCLKMAKESGVEYTHLIWTRTDSLIDLRLNKDNFYNFNKKDRVYGLNAVTLVAPNELSVDDTFFIGNYHTLSKVIDTINENTIDGIHFELSLVIYKLGLFVEALGNNINFVTIRANVKELEESQYNNPNLVARKTLIWGNKMKEYIQKNYDVE
jgi:hypothetical protein